MPAAADVVRTGGRARRAVGRQEETTVDRTRTRKLEAIPGDRTLGAFLAAHRAALVVLSGRAAGSEHELDRDKLVIGRGTDVDLCFDDSSMSREHAVVEFGDGGFRIRDLGSTNGVVHNGAAVQAASLEHGDRLQLGEHGFQYVCEEMPTAPEVYVVEDD
jgi:pSer/pThr/pTyr-binding forkhead associated (FHA) protein